MNSECVSLYLIIVAVGVGLIGINVLYVLWRISKARKYNEVEDEQQSTLFETMKNKKAVVKPLFIHTLNQAASIGVIFEFFQLWYQGGDCGPLSS